MDQATIAELRLQVERIREVLGAEPAALDRERLRRVADAIDEKLAKAARGGKDVGG